MSSNRLRVIAIIALGLAALVVLGAGKGAVSASAAGPGVQPALPTAVPTSATGSPTPTGIIPTRVSTRLPTAVPTTGLPTVLPTTGLPTVLPTARATECANGFVDIDGNVFYGAIHFLSCGGIVSGTDPTHYNPAATASRAQFAKIVVLGFDVPPVEPSSQTFTDVPSNYFAHRYIESGYVAGILSGFTAAQCQAANATFPCYLPNRSITRAELTRLVVNAAHYPLIEPQVPSFDDVPLTNFAYAYIETAYRKGVVHGTDATHFEPGRSIRRDEMAQIIYAGMTTP